MRRAIVVVLVIGCSSSSETRTSSVEISRPTAKTVAALKAAAGEITALSFAGESDLGDQVHGYFADLSKQAGKPIAVRDLDRMIDVGEAMTRKVMRAETVVLVSGERSEHVDVRLRKTKGGAEGAELFDRDVERALIKIGRPMLRAEVLGAGEPTDPLLKSTQLVTQALQFSDYKTDGSGPPSLLVFVDNGARPIDGVLARLDAHVAAGGAAFVAIEPIPGTTLGPLESRLKLRFDATPLADDKNFLTQRKHHSDRGNIVTNSFASHPATSAMSRAGANTGTLFLGAGSLEAAGDPAPVFLIRTQRTAFRDANANFQPDGDEQRDDYPIAAAVEAGKGRVVIYADAHWLSDAVARQVGSSAMLLGDGIRWLANQEQFVIADVDDEPSKQVALTRYPLRPRGGKQGPELKHPIVWKRSPSDIASIELSAHDRTIAISRRGDHLWGREQRAATAGSAAPPAREFPIDDEIGDKLLVALAEPRSLRVIGKPDAARTKELKLDQPDRLVVTFRDDTRALAIGGSVYGGRDRYVADAATGEVHVLDSTALQLVYGGEMALRLRSIVPPAADVAKVAFEIGGTRGELPVGDDSAVAGTPEGLGAFIVDRARRLGFIAFVTEADAGALKSIAKLAISTRSGATVELELVSSASDSYVRNVRFGLAKVSAGAADQLARALEQAATTKP